MGIEIYPLLRGIMDRQKLKEEALQMKKDFGFVNGDLSILVLAVLMEKLIDKLDEKSKTTSSKTIK